MFQDKENPYKPTPIPIKHTSFDDDEFESKKHKIDVYVEFTNDQVHVTSEKYFLRQILNALKRLYNKHYIVEPPDAEQTLSMRNMGLLWRSKKSYEQYTLTLTPEELKYVWKESKFLKFLRKNIGDISSYVTAELAER